MIDGQVSSMNVPKVSLSGQVGTSDAGICKMALAFCLPARILAVRRDSGKQCHCATILVPLRKTSMWFSENLKVGSVDFCEALVPSKYFPGGLASEVVKNNEKTWFTYIPQILNVNN